MFTKSRLKIITASPTTFTHAAGRPRQPAVVRACRYPAYTTQAMNAQVSLGSQPQYRPQALSAQTAPAMTANVQTGNPKTAVRCATRSRLVAEGSRSTTRNPEPAGASPVSALT